MRHHRLGRGNVFAAWLIVASLIVVVPPASVASAAVPEKPARLIRAFDLDDLSITNPGGIAFSNSSGTFHVLEATGGVADAALKEITPHEQPRGTSRIAARVTDPVNVTYDDVFERLLIYATPSDQILTVSASANGDLDPSTLTHTNAKAFGITAPKGMAVDPATGDLLILDAAGPRIVRLTPGAEGSFENATLAEVELAGAGVGDVTSLAIHPTTGHLFTAATAGTHLYELSADGGLVATWDIGEAELVSPGGMAFAASGDLTDDPAQVSIYISDTGISGGTETLLSRMMLASAGDSVGSLRTAAAAPSPEGQIVEVSLIQPQATVAAATTFTSTLIQEIEAFGWSPPSPDTSGVVYLPASNTLMAVDGEVNEMSIYAGANVFEAALNGNLVDTWTTLDFGNNEPTGVSVDPSDGTLYISRDTPPKEIYVWDPGANGTYETSDNITSFVTADFGATDPEGVTYAVGLDRLFIADGLNNEIYQLSPGSNGVFDGVPPAGDDVVVDHFDILAMGMEDPEGVAYDPNTGNLYIAGKTRNIGSWNFDTLLEVSTSGSLVQTIDVSDINPGRQYPRQKLSGLALGPSSQNPSQLSIYIADRGEDNNNDPNENDGRIYEATISSGGGPINNPPVANDDTAVTSQGTQVNIDVAANDTDPDGNLDPSSVNTISGPSNGNTNDNNNGTIDYTPTGSYTGPDQFTYEICDTDGLCDTAVVDVTVTQSNVAPVANDDTATTDEDTSVTIDVAANDTDTDGNLDPTTAATQTGPSDGSTTDNGDGTITYTPNDDFNGSDSFTYEICDDLGLCDTATVDVTVNPVADPPVAVDDSASTGVNTQVVIDVAGNDSDPDGDLDPSTAVTLSSPSNGGTTDNGNGTITYTPDVDFTGPDSFTYEICDASAQCDQATVDVNVSGDQILYVSSTSGGNVGGVAFDDEDILAFDSGSGTWSMFFDGSDVGLSASGMEVDAFHINADGSIIMSFGADGTIPDVGTIQDHDLVRFIPTSTGETTAGSYEMYLNGEDFELSTNGEDIDGVGFAPDGRLVVSLRGYWSVGGMSGLDVDLLAFDGANWELYLDGVAVGLDGGNTEDVTAAWIDGNGDVYLSVRSAFTVPGLSGDSADIFTCQPNDAGPITDCVFSMFWDGSDPAHGFGSESINGMFISGGGPTQPPTPQVSVTATDADAGEPSNHGEFTFTRTGPTTDALTVAYTLTGSATNGTDYATLSGSVTIPAGQASTTEPVTVSDDADVEGDETVVLTLLEGSDYDVGSPASGTVTITDDDVPSVSVSASDAVAGEPANDGEFTFSRSDTTGPLTVFYTVTGSATAGVDYTALSGSVTMAHGQPSATVPVDVIDDSDPESTESVVVTIAADPAYSVGSPSSAQVDIADDDPPPVPLVSVTASDPDAGEPNNDGEFTFTRIGSTAGSLTVTYVVTGSATNGTDYASLSGSVDIADGDTSVTVLLDVSDDSEVEGPETVMVTVLEDSAYDVGSPSFDTVTIADDDLPEVTIAATSPNAAEPGTDGGFTVTRTGPTTSPLTVDYTVTGSATAGSDYATLSGSVTISGTQSTATITVTVIDDAEYELTEDVIVTLSSGPGYNVGSPSSDTVTIADDGDLPVVSVTASDPNAAEPNDDGEFTVTRTGDTTSALTVYYTVTGSATAGSDYTIAASPVTIPAGSASQTIPVTVLDDGDEEGTEDVVLTLSADSAYSIGTPESATVTITDEDGVTISTLEVRVSAGDDDAEERPSGSVSLGSSDLELIQDKNNAQTVGIRFQGIPIQPGATIVSAWVQFQTDETSSVQTDLTIRAEATGNAAAFVNSSGDITSRTPTNSFALWSVPAWNSVGQSGPDQRTPDLTALIQEVVNNPGWGSGNALSLIISGTGSRVAESYNGDSSAAPLLHIEYSDEPVPNSAPIAHDDATSAVVGTPAPMNVVANDFDIDGNLDPFSANTDCGGCSVPSDGTLVNDGDGTFTYTPVPAAGGSTRSFVYEVCDLDGLCDTATVTITVLDMGSTLVAESRISASSDDAEERPSGSVRLNSSDLEMVMDKTNEQIVGLRFNNIDVPDGASITNAWIQFQVDETSSDFTDLLISAQLSPNAGTFLNNSGDISSRPTTEATVAWTDVPAWTTVGAAGPDQQTPDISALIGEIVVLDGWGEGNSIVIIITGSGSRVAEAYDGFSAAAPLLHIEYTIS